MRISEITDKNKVILSVSNIDIDFESEYKILVKLLELMIRLKSPSRNLAVLGNIKQFEYRVNQLLQSTLIDKTDPDIVQLIENVKSMQLHINNLKAQLIF